MYDSKPLACINGAAFIGLLELLAILALAAAGFGVLRPCTLAIAADWRQRLRETFSLSSFGFWCISCPLTTTCGLCGFFTFSFLQCNP